MGKDISLECVDCEGTFLVSVKRAKRQECPNCFSDNVRILDELPEDVF